MQGSVTSLCLVQTTNNGAIEAMFRFTLWHRQQEERMEIYFELQRQSLDNHQSAREPPSMVGEVFSCPTKGVNYSQCGCVARCVSVYTVTTFLSIAVKYIYGIYSTQCVLHTSIQCTPRNDILTVCSGCKLKFHLNIVQCICLYLYLYFTACIFVHSVVCGCLGVNYVGSVHLSARSFLNPAATLQPEEPLCPMCHYKKCKKIKQYKYKLVQCIVKRKCKKININTYA